MNVASVVSEVIHKRQSIYPVSFTGDLISNDDIMLILANANQSPSHKNTEPWRFHVVCDPQKESYANFAQASYKDFVPAEKFKSLKYDKLKNKILKSSHIIMISCQLHPESGLPEWEEMAAVSSAVQNIYLTVTAKGYGGYWSSPSFIIENASKYFKMRPNEICMGVFYLGIPKEDLPPPVVKGDVEEKCTWYK